jgi:hypothetical protein
MNQIDSEVLPDWYENSCRVDGIYIFNTELIHKESSESHGVELAAEEPLGKASSVVAAARPARTTSNNGDHSISDKVDSNEDAVESMLPRYGDPAQRFIDVVAEDVRAGYGFVPFLGAGLSVTAGIPMIRHLLVYLHRCICMVLGIDTRDENVSRFVLAGIPGQILGQPLSIVPKPLRRATGRNCFENDTTREFVRGKAANIGYTNML